MVILIFSLFERKDIKIEVGREKNSFIYYSFI